jgi:phosphomannomutase
MHHYEYTTVDGVKVIKKDGWALLRASNTGPNLTLRFESTTERGLKRIQSEFMDVLGILEK